jgi:hypothetical protein
MFQFETIVQIIQRNSLVRLHKLPIYFTSGGMFAKIKPALQIIAVKYFLRD